MAGLMSQHIGGSSTPQSGLLAQQPMGLLQGFPTHTGPEQKPVATKPPRLKYEQDRFSTMIRPVMRHEDSQNSGKVTWKDGNATKWGIDQKYNPGIDVPSLSKPEAMSIMKAKHWDGSGVSNVPDDKLASKLFDMSVNMGNNGAATLLQRALIDMGITVEKDGKLGDDTLSAIYYVQDRGLIEPLIRKMQDLQMGHYTKLARTRPADKKNLGGWLNRAGYGGVE